MSAPERHSTPALPDGVSAAQATPQHPPAAGRTVPVPATRRAQPATAQPATFMFATGIECSYPTIAGPNGRSVRIDELDVLSLEGEELRGARGSLVSYVPQDPAAGLNPAHRVGAQLREALEVHHVALAVAAKEVEGSTYFAALKTELRTLIALSQGTASPADLAKAQAEVLTLDRAKAETMAATDAAAKAAEAVRAAQTLPKDRPRVAYDPAIEKLDAAALASAAQSALAGAKG